MEESKPTNHISASDKYEIYTAILIGLATFLGALSAYFSVLWSGQSQEAYIMAIKHQSDANTSYLETLSDMTQLEMDGFQDEMFYSEWKNNLEKGDPDANYYFSLLSEGYQKDLKEDPENYSNWEKEHQEKLAAFEQRFAEVDAISDSSDVYMKKAQEAGNHGDDFTFATVLLTIVLFFGGLAALKTKDKVRIIYTAFAGLILIISIIRIVTVPFP
jgi:hypothetical protein